MQATTAASSDLSSRGGLSAPCVVEACGATPRPASVTPSKQSGRVVSTRPHSTPYCVDYRMVSLGPAAAVLKLEGAVVCGGWAVVMLWEQTCELGWQGVKAVHDHMRIQQRATHKPPSRSSAWVGGILHLDPTAGYSLVPFCSQGWLAGWLALQGNQSANTSKKGPTRPRRRTMVTPPWDLSDGWFVKGRNNSVAAVST